MISIPKKRLLSILATDMKTDTVLEKLGELGCDVEDVVEESLYRCRECGTIVKIRGDSNAVCSLCQNVINPCSPQDKGEFLSSREVIRMELLPSRPDLFDIGGLSRLLRGYCSLETGPITYKVHPSGKRITVSEELHMHDVCFRPYIASGIIKNIEFDDEMVKLIMELQENLHWGLGRNRRKAAIGIHDLGKITGDIRYIAVNKETFSFVPLAMEEKLTVAKILREHPKGVDYRHLVAAYQKVPILMDSEDVVLSMPPIINSEYTKVTSETRNIFLDITGLEKELVLDIARIVTTSLIELGSKAESVVIEYPDGEEIVSPDLNDKFSLEISLEQTRNRIGVELSMEDLLKYLGRMRYRVSQLNDNEVKVYVPPYRTDIIHPVDIMEDVAIAYGYHRIAPKRVFDYTIGTPRVLEEFCTVLRSVMVGMGFLETMSLMLSSRDIQFDRFELEGYDVVEVKNAISNNQTILRKSLKGGLLEILSINTKNKLPQRIFEIGDVVELDETQETKTRDIRRMAGAIVASKIDLSEMGGIVSTIFREAGITANWEESCFDYFIEGRQALIVSNGLDIGELGEVHLQALENFGIYNPVILFELDVSNMLKCSVASPQ